MFLNGLLFPGASDPDSPNTTRMEGVRRFCHRNNSAHGDIDAIFAFQSDINTYLSASDNLQFRGKIGIEAVEDIHETRHVSLDRVQ